MRAARILLSALLALWLAVTAAVALDRAIIGETDRQLQQLRIDLDGAVTQMRRPNLILSVPSIFFAVSNRIICSSPRWIENCGHGRPAWRPRGSAQIVWPWRLA